MLFKSTFVFVCGALTPGTEELRSGDPVTRGLCGHLCGDKAQPLGVSAALWLHLGGGQAGLQGDKPTGTAEQELQLLKMIILCIHCFHVTFNYQLLWLIM